MGVSVSGSLPAIVRNIYESAFDIQYSEFAMRHLVKQVGQGQKGNLIQWPYWDPTSATATLLTEGTAIAATFSVTNATKTIAASEFGYRTIYTYDSVERANDDIQEQHARWHGVAHGKKLEAKLLALFTGFTPALTATSATGVTVGTLAKAKALLEAKTTLVRGPLSYVTHPYSWLCTFNSETQNTNFGIRGDLGNEVLNKFRVGTVLGDVQIYTSNDFTVTGTGAASRITAGLFNKDAIGLWQERDFTMKHFEDIDLRGHKLVSTQKFGAAVLLPNFGVEITSYANTPS